MQTLNWNKIKCSKSKTFQLLGLRAFLLHSSSDDTCEDHCQNLDEQNDDSDKRNVDKVILESSPEEVSASLLLKSGTLACGGEGSELYIITTPSGTTALQACLNLVKNLADLLLGVVLGHEFVTPDGYKSLLKIILLDEVENNGNNFNHEENEDQDEVDDDGTDTFTTTTAASKESKNKESSTDNNSNVQEGVQLLNVDLTEDLRKVHFNRTCHSSQ